MLGSVVSLATFAAIALAAYGLGRPLLRGLRVDRHDRLESAVWSLALGLLAGGMLLVVLGLCDVLYVTLIRVLTLLAVCLGLWEIAKADGRRGVWRRFAGSAFKAVRFNLLRRRAGLVLHQLVHWVHQESHTPQAEYAPPSHCPDEGPLPQLGGQQERHSLHGASFPVPARDEGVSAGRWMILGVCFLASLAALGALLSALAPATAGDALCYHLELPKVFLARHALVDLPRHDNATFPLLTEIWFLWAMALDSAVAAQLVHFGLGVLLALATVLLARDVLGHRAALLAGGLVLLVPGVTNQMTAPLNDVALALFTTLALAAWCRAREGQGRRWFILAGLATGGALGIKYVALVFVAAVGIATVFHWLQGRMQRLELGISLYRRCRSILQKLPFDPQPLRTERQASGLERGAAGRPSRPWSLAARPWDLFRGGAILLVIAASVSGVWYLRAAWHRGNPVYPFFAQAFGSAGPDARKASKTPLTWQPADVATAPWQVSMHPERFGGRGQQLGGLFLALMPGLVCMRRLRGLGWLLGVAAAYAALWYALRQNVRFLLPVVPLGCVATAWGGLELTRLPGVPRLLAGGACALLLLFQASLPLGRAWQHLPVVVGMESRTEYLLRREPTHRAAMYVNQSLPPAAHILSQDYALYYFERPLTRESIYRRQTRYDRELNSPGQLAAHLRADGFTHLLLAQAKGEGIRYNKTLWRLAAAAARDNPQSLRTLLDYTHRDQDGVLRRYRLVELR
jgi:hypothetical protein